MINFTNMKIPKKYEEKLQEVDNYGDGYWVYSKKGFMFPEMGCHTAHEYTQKDLMKMIRTITVCKCGQCKE